MVLVIAICVLIVGQILGWHLYWMPIPGLAVCFLGGAAAWMTLRENMGREEKFIWTVLIFVLMTIEVLAITHDRSDQDRKHEKEITAEGRRFDELSKLLQGMQVGINLKVDADAALLLESRRVQQTQLKIRALNLSRDIAEFTTRVRMQEVAVPMPQTHGLASINDPAWDNWQAQLEGIEHNAVAQYNYQFGASVKDVVEQLKKRRVLDNTDCDGPKETTNRPAPSRVRFMYVLGCAQDLQLGASKLP